MRRIYEWLYGWLITLQIKYRQPELYRALTEPLDMDDFVEVEEPS